jgi:Na+-translocating ferredoxin:NAD+ oxidoreductase RnfE subunit
MNKYVERLYNGVIKENPTFVLMLGMCPTLAVTSSAINGLGMGLSLITPLYKRSTYLFITEHLLTHSGSNRWLHYSHLPLPLK